MERWGHNTELDHPASYPRARDRPRGAVRRPRGPRLLRRGGGTRAQHLPVRRAGDRQGTPLRPAARHSRTARPTLSPPAATAVLRRRPQPEARPRRPAGGARRGHCALPSTSCTCAGGGRHGRRRLHRRALAGGGRRRAAERPRGRRGRPASSAVRRAWRRTARLRRRRQHRRPGGARRHHAARAAGGRGGAAAVRSARRRQAGGRVRRRGPPAALHTRGAAQRRACTTPSPTSAST